LEHIDSVAGILSRLLPDPKLTPRIVRMATPVIFAMLTQTLINIMDTFFVGKLEPSVSIPGQAALGYSLPLIWIVGGCLSAVGVGTQAITGRRYGEGDMSATGKVLTNSLLIAFITGALFSVLSYLACPWMFSFLTTDEAVLALGTPYAQIRLLGVLSMVATMSTKAFFDGIGKTHIHMMAALVMNLVNLVLNYCLIFGVWIFPELKVEGAAWASLISTYVGLFLMIAWTMTPTYNKKFDYYSIKNIDGKVLWEITRLSVPSGMATVFVMAGVLMFMKIVGLLDAAAVTEAMTNTGVYLGDGLNSYALNQGDLISSADLMGGAMASDWTYVMIQNRPAVYTAATKVVFDVTSLCFISSLAFGTATATLVSQSLGEGKPDRAAAYGWDSVKIYTFLMAIAGLLTALWPEHAMDLISDDAVVIATGAQGMRIFGATMPFMAIGVICTQALFGAGNTKFVMVVEMILHFTCLVPLAYILSVYLEMGFLGVWISSAIYIFLLALVMSWKFWEGKWKDIKV
jgi:Na+-driven multidrug efflux pump